LTPVTQTITVTDTTPPTATWPAASVTMTCVEASASGYAPSVTGSPSNVADSCGSATATFADTETVPEAACPWAKTIARVWTVTDSWYVLFMIFGIVRLTCACSQNTASFTQTITITDNVAVRAARLCSFAHADALLQPVVTVPATVTIQPGDALPTGASSRACVRAPA
jgi:hypothetical protein